MRTVWKYTVNTMYNKQHFSMPEGAKVLHVDEQNGLICLWAEVNVYSREVSRYFYIIGTGRKIPDEVGDFLGTALIDGLVFHVFE